MAFQTADNVITVGNQTAGADGDVVVFEYMGGYRTAISGNGILYPDGSETQRKGIKIDIEVKPTINGLKQGRDEVLEQAIELASEENTVANRVNDRRSDDRQYASHTNISTGLVSRGSLSSSGIVWRVFCIRVWLTKIPFRNHHASHGTS